MLVETQFVTKGIAKGIVIPVVVNKFMQLAIDLNVLSIP